MRAHAFTTRAKNQGYFSLSGRPIFSARRHPGKSCPWLCHWVGPLFLSHFWIGRFFAGLCRSSMVAGVVGGTTLAFVWPFVFYLNIRTGGLFVRLPIAVDDLEDVTERTMSLLIWGKTFAIGALGQQPAGGCGCVFRVPAALSASPRSRSALVARSNSSSQNLSRPSLIPWHCRYWPARELDSAGYLPRSVRSDKERKGCRSYEPVSPC